MVTIAFHSTLASRTGFHLRLAIRAASKTRVPRGLEVNQSTNISTSLEHGLWAIAWNTELLLKQKA